jgi:hypothetical protein
MLMEVGHNQFRIFLVHVENALPVMHAEMYLGDTPDAILLPQCLDYDADISKHAEVRSMAASRMVQSAYGLKTARAFAAHNASQPVESRADHVRRTFEHVRKYRRIAIIEKLKLVAPGMHHFGDIALRMESSEFLARRSA